MSVLGVKQLASGELLPRSVLCDDREGWDEGVGGRLKSEGIYGSPHIHMEEDWRQDLGTTW